MFPWFSRVRSILAVLLGDAVRPLCRLVQSVAGNLVIEELAAYAERHSASDSRFGRHPTGSATHRLMSDSFHPAPLTLILIWGGNVPSAILR